MDLTGGAGRAGAGVADAQLASFIEQENQKQRFQAVVHTLTEQCWDLCVSGVTSRLDGKTETCLANCVERFIDSSNYIINKLGQEGAAAVAKMDANEFGSSRDFSLGAPDMGLRTPEFATDYDSTSSSSSNEKNKGSSWKFW